MWVEYNENPNGRQVGDCTVRAIAKATGSDWLTTFWALALQGAMMGDMPSANSVGNAYLRSIGFRRYPVPDTYPDTYTISDFCTDHPDGVYVVGTGSHVVAVVDGDYYDSWDSGDEIPVYYLRLE